ncbi:MAG: TSUP family transporter [Saprospiraceae bacterium]
MTRKNLSPKNHLFPVFLKLSQLDLLLVGGGNVALEKLQAILANSPEANITIVAPEIKPELLDLINNRSHILLQRRKFEASDLQNKDIAICATDDKALHVEIKTLAAANHILVNVADTPELCDFYLSSIVQKGNLKIGISTNGLSPTAAKRIKETLNEALPESLDDVLFNLHTIRKTLVGDFNYKSRKMKELTQVLGEQKNEKAARQWKKLASISLLVFASMLLGYFVFSLINLKAISGQGLDFFNSLDRSFYIMVGAGFLAQLVDGSLGMGYGVTSAIILLSAGISPATISGSIHTAEMFASGASGYSHYKFGNVNKKLFKALVIPGVIGAIVGALLLVYFGNSQFKWLRPALACYTLFLGVKFFINAFSAPKPRKKFKFYRSLAGFGGFFDSFGGGGWGPIVTSTLVNQGRNMKYVVGSVSLTEFFVTMASAFTFFTLLGISHWKTILGLIIGGLIAAPIAAQLVGKLPRKTSYILLGLIVIIWSIRILIV